MNNQINISTSVLKGKAIYGDLLLKEGYNKSDINDLAISEFLEFEHERVGESSDLHLLAIKKILLYAIPVIAPHGTTTKRGIELTAQFSTDCIINDATKRRMRLVSGDKYILLGFSFNPELVNNLDISAFEWKYYYKYPRKYIAEALDISYLNGIKKVGKAIYLIETSAYEDTNLYNNILQLIKEKLNEFTHSLTSILYQLDTTNKVDIEEFNNNLSIKPLNNIPIIAKLNKLLEKQIDTTFSASYYEILRSTANWLLFDQIYLFGYDADLVSTYLDKLKYTKEENIKVFLNIIKQQKETLEQTRAEKIAREKFPFYFSETDNRGIFLRFTPFNLNKLKKSHKNEILLLLEKDLAYQRAITENKCPHLALLKQLQVNIHMFKELEAYVDYDKKISSEHIYYCKSCTHPLLCEHDVEFYSNAINAKDDNSGNDMMYIIQQSIINKYKQTNYKGNDSDRFTYFCKYCSKELGKSDDIIQVSMKDTMKYNAIAGDHDELRNQIYFMLAGILSTNVNPLVIKVDKKRLIRSLLIPIKDELESLIYSFEKFKDDDKIEQYTKLSTLILCLAALISFNINVLKTNQVLLQATKVVHKKHVKEEVEPATEESESDEELVNELESENEPEVEDPTEKVTGGSIKVEFANAFSIIKNSQYSKQLALGDDKIKSLLINYYRKVAKSVGDLVDVSSMIRSHEDKFVKEVEQSALYNYLKYIVNRNQNSVIKDLPFETVMGTKVQKNKVNVYTNLPHDTTKKNDSRAKYIKESYNNIRSFIVDERYNKYGVEPELSEFITNYQKEQKLASVNKSNPYLYLKVENTREFNFTLKNLNLLYCAKDAKVLQKHKWKQQKCELCGITIKEASNTYNKDIEKAIDKNLMYESFFELYSVVCPVKDVHLFEDNKCLQCAVTKEQLESHDNAYYKQFMKTFVDHRIALVNVLLEKIQMALIKEKYVPLDNKHKQLDEKDLQSNIDQLSLSISKVYDLNREDLINLDPAHLDSFIRLIYERYSYAKNASIDMVKHTDVEFYNFVKANFFNGIQPIKIDMKSLPAYDFSNDNNYIKVNHLLTLINTMIKSNQQQIINLGRFLIKKIIEQESRRKDFNFAKLKAYRTDVIDDESIMTVDIDDLDEDDEDTNESSLFMAYDIDMENAEDNIDGDLD